MDDAQYHYLDAERVKLWNDLRQTQEQVKTILRAIEGGVSEEEKMLIKLSNKAASAYHRIQARDQETAQFSEHINASKVLGEACLELEQEITRVRHNLTISEQEINNARNEFDAKMSGLEDRATALQKKEEKIEAFVNEAESTTDEAQSLLDDIEERHTESEKKYQDIAKLHRVLFGFTKDNGEVVEGKNRHWKTPMASWRCRSTRFKPPRGRLKKNTRKNVRVFLRPQKPKLTLCPAKFEVCCQMP